MHTQFYKIFTFCFISILALGLQAQKVSSVHFEPLGTKIIIYYSLSSPSDKPCSIEIYYKTTLNSEWVGPLVFVTGNIGPNQFPGIDKAIIWDATKEVDNIIGGIQFWVNPVVENKRSPIPPPVVALNKPNTFTENKGIYTDERDGQAYAWVKIGNQIWMAESLNIGEFIDNNIEQKSNGIIEKYCYNNSENNCKKYGGLYQWDELMDFTLNENCQGICPSGWNIPTKSDFEELTSIADKNVVGAALKESGFSYTKKNYNNFNNNPFGFSAIMSGLSHRNKDFVRLNSQAVFWSSTSEKMKRSDSKGNGAIRLLLFSEEANFSISYTDKMSGLSVRCIKKHIGQ